jgi:hypothetical protein
LLTNGIAAWKYYLPEARAAITAMRELTDEIKREAGQSEHGAIPGHNRWGAEGEYGASSISCALKAISTKLQP